MKTALLLFALLGLSCAFSGGGYGINAAWVIGEASLNCTYDPVTGVLIGGDGCHEGGHLSPGAVELLSNDEQ